ncbi:P-loop NTPase [Candidatus Woesearchaeota archaeon]|nr:P-loop NTPase [Candidatus Woesearchaeota archaeon]
MTKFVAVVSGKGGAGKTTATLNIGQALLGLGRHVIVVDANLVTPNIAIHLGFMNPKATLNQFLRQEKSLKEITYLHESGLSIIPASPSYAEFQKTNVQNISEIFEHLDDTVDFVLVDAPSGVGYDVSQVLKNSDEAIIVVNPTLSSMIEALKTIELAKANQNTIAGVILNMTTWGRNELRPEEVEKYLEQPLSATVRLDRKIRKAAYQQMPLNYIYPRCRSARQFRKVAEQLCMQP